jgi:hypothetical protein
MVTIYDLGSPTEFNATTEFYLPAKLRILLTTLQDGANFGVEQEHFPENDLTWRLDVTMMTCHVQRGDRCHSKIG